MKDLLCISLDHTLADTAERAAAWPEDTLHRLKNEGRILEGLLLSTCNRSELYLRLPPETKTPPELFHPKARTFAGTELALHLLRILLGLESLACGEYHIAGQVKTCYEENSHLCGPWLHRLFQSSLRMAKLLRTCYHPGTEPSIARLMLDRFASHFRQGSLSVLVLGTGQTGEEMARMLLSLSTGRGAPGTVSIALTNRTPERAETLAERLSQQAGQVSANPAQQPRVFFLPWERWRGESGAFDALFFCTAAPLPLFSMDEARAGQKIFDLGSPPQVRRSSASCGNAPLISIDDLAETAEEISKSYRKQLGRLETEAAAAAVSVLSELETLSGETYKRLVLRRAERIVADRAERTARRTGADEETLRKMGWSVVKALLSPAFAESEPHARRLWKILSGDMEEPGDE